MSDDLIAEIGDTIEYGEPVRSHIDGTLTIELDDIVEFKGKGDYTQRFGEGKVVTIFKNGNLKVNCEGRDYHVQRDDAFLLRKAV